MKLSIASKGIILVAIPLIFEIAFVSALVFSLKQIEAQTERRLRSQAIVEKSTILLRQMVSLGICTVVFQSNNAMQLSNGEQSIGGTLKQLDKLVGTEAILKPSYKEVKRSARRFHQMLSKFGDQDLGSLMSNMSSTSLFIDVSETLRQLNRSVRSFSLVAESNDFVHPKGSDPFLGIDLRTILCFGVVFNLGVTILLAMNFARNISSRLSKLAENTRRVSCSLEPIPLLGGNDELSSLDLVIHRMSQQLQAADKQRMQLANMLRNRLQEPLAASVRLLRDLQETTKTELNASGQEWIRTSAKNLERLIMLLNDLLQLENIRAGFIELNQAEFNSKDLLGRSLDAVQSLLSKKNIQVVLKGPVLDFRGDADRLTQVLINFLSNAIKFSPANSKITISTTEGTSSYEFRVKDEGPGIERDVQSKIFERYEQSKREDATKSGGTGLGLNICAIIVKSHGGTIGVESEPGIGSEFWFRIPRNQDGINADPQNDSRKELLAAQALPMPEATATGGGAGTELVELSGSLADQLPGLRIWHKGIIIVAVPLFFQAFFLAVLCTMVVRAEAETTRQLHAMRITATANAMFRESVTLGTTAGGVFLRRDDDRDFYAYGVTANYLFEQTVDLFQLIKNDPDAARKASVVFHRTEKVLQSTGKLMLGRGDNMTMMELASFKKRVAIIQSSLDGLAQSIGKLLEKQKKIEDESPALRAQAKADIECLIVEAVVLSVLLSVLLGAFFSTSISKRVNILIEDTLRFTEGKPLLPMLQGHDELQMFHSDFKQMVLRLAENQEFKQQMLSVVSHELRTPLTSVFGSLTMLQQGVYGTVSAENAVHVQSAYDNVLQVILLVNDLLDLERIEAGKFPVELQEVDPLQALEAALASAKEINPDVNFSIADKSSGKYICADPVLCTKALSRIILFCHQSDPQNSYQSDQQSSQNQQAQCKQIVLEADNNKIHNKRLFIKVPYSGKLFKEMNNKQIFEKFQFLEKSDEIDLRGSALSLALSRTILDQMQGQVSFASDYASDYFLLELPLAVESEISKSNKSANFIQ